MPSLTRVSHKSSNQFCQTALPDAEENPGLTRISHKFLEKIAARLTGIAFQLDEDSVQATRPRPAEREDRSTECASFPRNGEKCGLTSFEGEQMGIKYKILVGYSLDDSEIKQVKQTILALFSEIDAIYNDWNPESEISRLNNLPADCPVRLSPSLHAFLKEIDRLVMLTEGRFDPTVGPLKKKWLEAVHLARVSHQHSSQFGQTVLSDAEENPEGVHLTLPRDALKADDETDGQSGRMVGEKSGLGQPIDNFERLPGIGWKEIVLTDSFSKKNASTQLDLGGIAKGLAVDRLAEKLQAWKSVYVEWGGEIRVVGRHPSGRQWKVGLPNGEVIHISDSAVATSGNTFQKWELGGNTFCHIFDPRSQMPVLISPQSIATATVVAPNCMLADALATSLMLFPSLESALQWAAQFEEIKIVLTSN